MSDDLRKRLNALEHCLGLFLVMLADAETYALPGPTLDGLQRARIRLTAIQGWLAVQGEK